MKTIPLEQFSSLSEENFLSFLRDCQGMAQADGEAKIVSVSLPVAHLDPLAVLESIYEETQPHFYWEQPSAETGLAGAEVVEEVKVSGKDRFTKVGAWTEDIFRRTIYTGPAELPFSGPHALGGFTFAEVPGEGSSFPSGYFFIPRWQVAAVQGRCTATANLRITPEGDLAKDGQRVWRAHKTFSRFHYHTPAADGGFPAPVVEEQEAGGPEAYRKAVAQALQEIHRGDYEKVVLARALDLRFSRPIEPLAALNDLRNQYPACFNFSFSAGRGESFLGATPERLLQVNGHLYRTEAIAGSAARGKTAVEDARRGGALLESVKDRHEHQLVIDTILKRFKTLGLMVKPLPAPRLLTLPNVHHLRTPVHGEGREGLSPMEVLDGLHPTPAVGGKPLPPALAAIPRLEAFDRGPYAGTLGWIGPKGAMDFLVAIRSALLKGEKLRLFAGAGIVADSQPDTEWAETELKFKAMRDAFGLTAKEAE
ncbi:MAG: isochorismate synthase [Opitutales bacterium]|nr:isochorismate synthase [Opitutales bacterium]